MIYGQKFEKAFDSSQPTINFLLISQKQHVKEPHLKNQEEHNADIFYAF